MVIAQGPLTAEDIAALGVERATKAPSLMKIRESHHTLARMVADGASLEEISAVTGYSYSRVSVLKSDPAFSELVAFHQRRKTEIDAAGDIIRRDIHINSLNRLEEKAEAGELTVNQELELLKITGSHMGLGPKSATVNVNLGLADKVAAGRKRVPIIDVTPEKESAA